MINDDLDEVLAITKFRRARGPPSQFSLIFQQTPARARPPHFLYEKELPQPQDWSSSGSRIRSLAASGFLVIERHA